MSLKVPQNVRVEAFGDFTGGVNSSRNARLIGQNQLQWGTNVVLRNDEPRTRYGFRWHADLPDGLFQGAMIYSVGKRNYIVSSINGCVYINKIEDRGILSSSEITSAGNRNSSRLRMAYFEQAEWYGIIQNGLQKALIFDGAKARRAEEDEVPVGTAMSYVNGRLWLAQHANVKAGDIVGAGGPLKFTEDQYIAEGGAFYMGNPVMAIGFVPQIDTTTGQGELIVGCRNYTNTIAAQIVNRLSWKETGMQRVLFPNTGITGPRACVGIEQDFYFKSPDGIRSYRNTGQDYNEPGTRPISNEVIRSLKHDSKTLSYFASMVYWDNRLLCLSRPKLNGYSVVFDEIISLDFNTIADSRNQYPPAYDGVWTGLSFMQVLAQKINGQDRCFLIVKQAGKNQIWEIDPSIRHDEYDGTKVRINSSIETKRMPFGEAMDGKKLWGFEGYMSQIRGQVDFSADYKPDDFPSWTPWGDSQTFCAGEEQCEREDCEPIKSAQKQYRRDVRIGEPSGECNSVDKTLLKQFDEVAVRLRWTGEAAMPKFRVFAETLEAGFSAKCQNETECNVLEAECEESYRTQPEEDVTEELVLNDEV